MRALKHASVDFEGDGSRSYEWGLFRRKASEQNWRFSGEEEIPPKTHSRPSAPASSDSTTRPPSPALLLARTQKVEQRPVHVGVKLSFSVRRPSPLPGALAPVTTADAPTGVPVTASGRCGLRATIHTQRNVPSSPGVQPQPGPCSSDPGSRARVASQAWGRLPPRAPSVHSLLPAHPASSHSPALSVLMRETKSGGHRTAQ